MLKFVQKKLKEEKGLTLIELLAVIVILGIIAAIAIPAIGNIIGNSRVGAVKGDAQNALAAANIYYTDNADAASPVTVSTLNSTGYLQDIGSLTTDTEIDRVATGNTIDGSGTVGGITLTFSDATNNQINDVPNNSPNGAVAGTNVSIAGR